MKSSSLNGIVSDVQLKAMKAAYQVAKQQRLMPLNEPYQTITIANSHGSSGDVRYVSHVGAVGPQGLSLP